MPRKKNSPKKDPVPPFTDPLPPLTPPKIKDMSTVELKERMLELEKEKKKYIADLEDLSFQGKLYKEAADEEQQLLIRSDGAEAAAHDKKRYEYLEKLEKRVNLAAEISKEFNKIMDEIKLINNELRRRNSL